MPSFLVYVRRRKRYLKTAIILEAYLAIDMRVQVLSQYAHQGGTDLSIHSRSGHEDR